jgi:acid stress chaperone HdeB
MKRAIAAAIVTTFLGLGNASAQTLDLSKVSCKEFLESGKDSIGLVMTWLDAYYRDEDDDPIMDFDRMKVNGEKLATYCRANPSTRLTVATDSLFDKK